ncbi:MAG: hypothetical protein MK081_06085 [Flavobacteriales bacterium]|nr:hypothetical protein [Flavobacteriales bacterium]
MSQDPNLEREKNNAVMRIHKIAEVFWLIVVIVTFAITAYWWYTGELAERKVGLIMPAIALLWYFLRRNVRRRLERTLGADE